VYHKQFFDLRAARHPLLVGRGGHSHWVWNVLYNPFHDQLVLSTGTDSVVNLWRVSSISSAPLLALADDAYDDDEIMAGDGGPVATRNLLPSSSEVSSPNNARVARHEHHGGDAAAVYGAAWGGGADPWIYATLGYDGRVALNHVPSQEKYKILL
jgi:WD40 repeat protein